MSDHLEDERREGDIVVLAVNLFQRLAVRDDDTLGDIRTFLDDEGDETEDVDGAEWAVVEWRDGGWSTLVIDDYDFDQPSAIVH